MVSFVKVWLLALCALQAGQGLCVAPMDRGSTSAPPITRLNFRSYGREQGLRNITVSQLIQDRQGFLWAGTDDGLYRYDGSRFQLFSTEQGLQNTLVNVMHLDHQGQLWVGTEKGLARLQEDRFETQKQGIPAEIRITDLANGPGGELWVGTDKGIYVGSAEKGFREFAAWGPKWVYALCSSPDGQKLWAAGRRDLYRIETNGDPKIVDEGGKAGTEGIERLLADGSGSLWVRSLKGLYLLSPEGARLQPVAGALRAESSRSRMFLDERGALWYPNEKGLAHLEQGRWTQLGRAEGLPADFARAVLKDHEGTLWVGSRGLFRILGRGLWSSAGSTEGLPVPVWSIHRDSSRTLWIGTQKGLVRHTPKGWEVLKGTEAFTLRSLAQSSDGSIYMGGEPARILVLNPRSGRVALLPELPGKEPRILRLLAEGEDSLWIGTRGSGLLLGRRIRGQWGYERVALPGGIERERIYHLLRDRQGRLWAAGSQGLACLSGGRWTRFTTKDGLLAGGITYLAENAKGELWAAYLDPLGLSKVRLEGDRLRVVTHLGAAQGLNSLEIYFLALDARDRLWLGTNKGIDLVDQPDSAEPRVRHQGVEDGLVDEDMNAMAILCEPNGDVWVGARGGLGHFRGAQDPGSPAPPATVILQARLGGQIVSLASSQVVSVPYRDNTLEVRFAGVSFANEAALEQQVRLEGLEKDWVSQETRELRYPGLGHGRYRLLLRSRIARGEWGPVKALAFEIRPAWWQTWGFRLALFLSLGMLIYLLIRWRLQRLRRRNEELAALVEARTRDLAHRTLELEHANQALERLSLTDPLTGLNNRRFLNMTIPDDVARVNRTHRDVVGSLKERALLNIDLIFIMVDVDHFKRVNDEYGHAAGDKVLQQLAGILRHATRDSDTTIRWGGEEFLVVARNACRADANILVERIRSQVEDCAFEIGEGRTLRCTCSLGFAFYPFEPRAPEAFGWEQVVELADRCLYAAKRGGRNAWVGIFPAPEADLALLHHIPPSELESLFRKGLLQIKTSLPRPEDLNWERHESRKD